MPKQFSQAGKEELALAIILWKDFKSQGKFDIDISMQAIELAKTLNILEIMQKMQAKIPVMEIKPRHI